jgi:hypothetical protein
MEAGITIWALAGHIAAHSKSVPIFGVGTKKKLSYDLYKGFSLEKNWLLVGRGHISRKKLSEFTIFRLYRFH